MTSETQAAQHIINRIEIALASAQCPSVMMENILDKAQSLVSEGGFVWDVALAIACQIYPKTQHCARYAYEA